MGFPLFSMEWPAQRSAGGAHEGSRWAAQRTHRMQAASGCAPEGAHEPCSTIHAPRRGAGHAGTKTGGCGSPAGRTCPPATFIGPLRGRDWPIPISHSTENSGELKWVWGFTRCQNRIIAGQPSGRHPAAGGDPRTGTVPELAAGDGRATLARQAVEAAIEALVLAHAVARDLSNTSPNRRR